MWYYKIDSCCRCLKLRTGIIIGATLGLLGSIILLSKIIFLMNANIDYEHFRKNNEFLLAYKEVEDVKGFVTRLCIMSLLFYLINGVFLALLLYGAIARSRKFLLPWLILVGSLTIAAVYLGVVLVIIYPIILVGIPFIGLAIYLWLVVLNYYLELDATDSNHGGKSEV